VNNTQFTIFYEDIKSKDIKQEVPYGWIQWKGTHVCIDLHCDCGYLGHVDDSFFYYYECPACNKKYAVGSIIKLIPLSNEQVEFLKETSIAFKNEDI
jgi:hypothetical protein